MRRYVLVLALLAAACTGGANERPRATPPTVAPYTPGPEDRAVKHGRCVSGFHSDDDPMRILTRPGIWFRVDGIGIRTALDRRPSSFTTVPGVFVNVGGDAFAVRQLPGVVTSLYVRNATADAIVRVLGEGARVHVLTGGHGDRREVAYAVAESGPGTALVGDCAYDDLTVPLAARVGPPDAYLRAMVGQPPEEIRRIIRMPADRVAVLPANLRRPNPIGSQGPPLARMRIGRLVLTAPVSWHATGVVCVVVSGGRSACLSPYAARLGRTAEFRYDPAMPWGQLRFYRLARPGKSAYLDSFAMSPRYVADRDLRVLRVVLRERPDGAAVAADAQLGRDAVASVRVERLP